MRQPLLALVAALTGALLWLSIPSTLAQTAESPQVELIHNATLVFRRTVDAPAAAIPAALLQQAKAIAIFPRITVDEEGARGGPGIVSARGRGSRGWSAPAVVTFRGGIEPQFDLGPADFVFVALTQRGLRYLSQGEATLAEPNCISPGPVGQDTRVSMDADILAYIQFGSYFAGVTVGGWSLREAKDANASLYGKPYSTADVLQGGFTVPAPAQEWRDAIASYFKEMS
jgi:lipid-binding SYLF domain-containing protein